MLYWIIIITTWWNSWQKLDWALQPVDTSVVEGGEATFTVLAVGSSEVTYQWRVNPNGTIPARWVILPETTNTLTIHNIDYSNEGDWYQCIASAPGFESIESDFAQLTIAY